MLKTKYKYDRPHQPLLKCSPVCKIKYVTIPLDILAMAYTD